MKPKTNKILSDFKAAGNARFGLTSDTEYTSKTKRGECKNEKCKKPRRPSSAYCQKCSDKKKGVV